MYDGSKKAYKSLGIMLYLKMVNWGGNIYKCTEHGLISHIMIGAFDQHHPLGY